MGIFRYFRYITKKYPDSYSTIKRSIVPRNTLSNPDTKGVECVLFDLNSIIHPCFQKVFEYGHTTESTSFLKNQKQIEIQQKKDSMTYEELEIWAFNMVTKKIEEYVYYTKPTKVIYIAVDGSPGSSKSNQQRKRRFTNAKNPLNGRFQFDPNSLTCGTELMNRLCKHIYLFIKKKKMYEWKSLQIIFSNSHVPGEGENKLKLWIESEPKYQSLTIISPDGDVIMLAMLIERNEVNVFRENIFDDIPGDYFFVNIITLKTLIYQQLRGSCMDSLLYPQRTIKDYVLFHYFLGNDFLPHIPSLEVNANSIALLYKCYNENCDQLGFLIEEYLSQINICKISFVGLVKKLAQYETKMLLDKFNSKTTYPNTLLAQHIIRGEQGNQLDFVQYRKAYYIKKFELNYVDEKSFERQIQAICNEYVIGLTFVLKYYFREIPTYAWQYPYHYAPFLEDLARYGETINFEIRFPYRHPLNVYESLFSVLPRESFPLLPNEVIDALPSKIKLDPCFSTDFEVDLEGKMYEYEGTTLLIPLMYDEVKSYFKHVKLTDEQMTQMIKQRQVYVFK
jgi:5'-3' exonuclease